MTRRVVSSDETPRPASTSDTVACETPASSAIRFWLTWGKTATPPFSRGDPVERTWLINRSVASWVRADTDLFDTDVRESAPARVNVVPEVARLDVPVEKRDDCGLVLLVAEPHRAGPPAVVDVVADLDRVVVVVAGRLVAGE